VKKIDKKLLEKFINSKCSQAEKEIVIKWFVENDFDTSLRSVIKDHFYKLLETEETELSDSELKALLDKVHHEINIRKFRKEKALKRYKRFVDIFSKAAAILIIPLLAVSFLFVVKNFDRPVGTVKIVAPLAARIQFTLPDGTSGWLNSGSVLKYRAGLQGNNRRVNLSGEAFFSVKKDKKHPFIVKSDKIEVKVLGTKFNVNAYPEDDDIEVTLQRGKVEVYGVSGAKITTPVIKLNPGEQVLVSKSDLSQMEKRKVDKMAYFTGWKDDLLVFRGDSMEDVAKKLSRWFNVQVIIKDEALKDYKLHATFHQESLEEILRLIKLTSPIDYKVIQRTKKQDGTYTKERIEFSKRE
jgi:ferric-dicitrate binding protein FerR (iron transport regulator)